MKRVLVVDGANVVGSRPDGWWRDRPGAARRLASSLAALGEAHDEVVLVLEGAARSGVPEGTAGRVRTVHAPRDGDATIVDEVDQAVRRPATVTVVTADRALIGRLRAVGADTVGPRWLLDRI